MFFLLFRVVLWNLLLLPSLVHWNQFCRDKSPCWLRKSLLLVHENPNSWFWYQFLFETYHLFGFVDFLNSNLPHGCVWKCCVALNPMVLLIIIPFLNGYFIGNINPTFSDKPICYPYVTQSPPIKIRILQNAFLHTTRLALQKCMVLAGAGLRLSYFLNATDFEDDDVAGWNYGNPLWSKNPFEWWKMAHLYLFI